MAGYILDVDKDGQYITTPLAFIAQRIHRLSQAKDFMNFTAVLQDHGAIQWVGIRQARQKILKCRTG